MADKTDIWVYADWKGMLSPKCIGILSASTGLTEGKHSAHKNKPAPALSEKSPQNQMI